MAKQDYAAGKKRMVRALISMGYTMRFDVPQTPEEKVLLKWQLVMKRLDHWFTTSSNSPLELRKPVNNMTYNELTKAVTVVRRLQQAYQKKTY